GELVPKFSVADTNDVVSYSKIIDSFISRDRRFGKRNLKILDLKTGKSLCTLEIENLVCATPELFVGVAVERIPTDKGYRYGKAFLESFDRTSFRRKWRAPMAE